MSLPDVQAIGAQIAARLKNIKVTATCRTCQEKHEAVVLEAPTLGLMIINEKRDSLEFARDYYQKAFDRGHPHKMEVEVEFTSLAAHAPRQVPYVV